MSGSSIGASFDLHPGMQKDDMVYRPTEQLTPGTHTASISFPGRTGGLKQYTWQFEKKAACP